MSDRTNHWRTLTYFDPEETLRQFRRLEIELADVDLPPDIRRLRTQEFNRFRELRDAALFTYGMSLAQGVPMGYADEESSDYDFVTGWRVADESRFCPVQLKELVPEDLDPRATIQGLLRRLGKYGRTDTVLAIKLNRTGELDLASLMLPEIPFKQLWFFWASAPNSARWCLFGDALRAARQRSFAYPVGTRRKLPPFMPPGAGGS